MGCKQSCCNQVPDQIELRDNTDELILQELQKVPLLKQQSSNFSKKEKMDHVSHSLTPKNNLTDKNQEEKTPIITFFQNKLAIDSKGEKYIEAILSSEENLLENGIEIFTWLFPNFFIISSSQLNQSLTLEDQQQILTDFEVVLVISLKFGQIAQRYLRGYKKILSFFGLQMMDELSGSLAVRDTEKFNQVMKFSDEVKRILASLSVLGFRKYAREFCRVLNQNVEGIDFMNKVGLEEYYVSNFQAYDQYTESLERELFFSAIFSGKRDPMILNQESIMLHLV